MNINLEEKYKGRAEQVKKVTVGDQVLLPSPRQFIGSTGVLGPSIRAANRESSRDTGELQKRPETQSCSLFAPGCVE